jgi:antitoxin CptB
MDSRQSKLRYRAWRRGFREADLILGPFADSHLEAMTTGQLDAFEALLDEPDHDLYGWIVAGTAPPPDLDGEVLAMIRRFRLAAHEAIRT